MNHYGYVYDDDDDEESASAGRHQRTRLAEESIPWVTPTPFDSVAEPFAIGRPTPHRFRSRHELYQRRLRAPTNRHGTPHPNKSTTATAMASNGPFVFDTNPWDTVCQTPPDPGYIRMLSHPDTAPSSHVTSWWWRDRTLTEWVNDIEKTKRDLSNNPIMQAVYPPTYAEDVATVFYTNQRERWLARVVVQRLRLRAWARRPACNVDMIDLQPVPDADAIAIADTTNKRIFRFHRRDLLNTVMSNLTMSDEYLPTPRHPTNPWTNERFTNAQTMAVCHRLAADFVKRGRCPPPLLSSFWDAHFNIKQFLAQNTAALSQQAIRSYFRELTDDNLLTVFETMTNLLSDAGVNFSPLTVRRWLSLTPHTAVHQAWVAFCRDYTLYINLHIQVRPHWYDTGNIYRDVRTLYANTPIREPPLSTRLRVIRNQLAHPVPQILPFSLLAPLPAPDVPAFSLFPSVIEPLPAPRPSLDALFDLMTPDITADDAVGVRGLLGLLLNQSPITTTTTIPNIPNIPPTTTATATATTTTTATATDISGNPLLQLLQHSLFR